MHQDRAINDFIEISHYVGSKTAYVQGGGGNTSVKFNSDRMLVKSSGLLLKDVAINHGFANVDYVKICEYLNFADQSEEAFNAEVISTNNLKIFRPSMETGFHAVLGKYVIHSHSVYANVLTCSVEGCELVKRLFDKVSWIDYCSPGRALTMAVKQNLRSKLFFLGNHGLIVHGETTSEVMELHESVNDKLKIKFGLEDFCSSKEPKPNVDDMNNRILFPDQVIYTNPKVQFENTTALDETLSAYSYIDRHLKMLGFTPSYLTNADANFLVNMDAEKHRLRVLQ